MSREHQRRQMDAPGSQLYSIDAAAADPAATATPTPAPFSPSYEGQQGAAAAVDAVQSLGTGSQCVADRRETPPVTLSQWGRWWWLRAHLGYRNSVVAVVVCLIVGTVVAAWTARMAWSSAQEAGRLRDQAEVLFERPPCCLDSVYVHLAPDDRRSLTVVPQAGDGGGRCCTINAAQLLSRALQVSDAYLKLGLAKVMPSMIYGAGKGVAQFLPSIHLELPASVGEQSRVNEARRCEAATEITMWTAHSSGHLRGDLFVKAGRISIKSTGYYHVYSQISSDDRSCRSATGLTLRRLRYSILRVNPSLKVVPDVLLAVETWRCTGDSRGQQSGNGGISRRTPIYLGATFLLLRGDQVYVMVSCVDDLKFDAAKTYFGMHMV